MSLRAQPAHDNLYSTGKPEYCLHHRHDLYRPKLIAWAKKLAYLLDHGWELAEIKNWAKGRFHTANPRQWPPKESDWQI